MQSKNEALKQLRENLPNGTVLTDPENRFRSSLDNARLSFLPDAVICPQKNEDIATVLKLANECSIPITARGGGTATTGAASPIHGGWVLDLASWKECELDPKSGIAYAQPGVTVAELQEKVEGAGWFYAPDPSSHEYATIGGTIACNAGGLRAGKYGVTRDYILALEGFLPTGEFVRWSRDVKKYASGFNIRDLWIGSEGMLGIITRAIIRLIPKPNSRFTLLVAFENEDEALDCVEDILEHRIIPSILEFLDRQSVACAETRRNAPFFPNLSKPIRDLKTWSGNYPVPSLLLIELDGHAAQVATDKERLFNLIKQKSRAFRTASEESEIDSLWAARRTCSQAMFQLGDTKLNEDVVVPLRSYKELIRYTLKLKNETGLATPTFGHAADGNFHVHVMFNGENQQQRLVAERTVQAIMKKVIDLGGVISGEHGIGLAKTPFFEMQHSSAEIAAMKAIKNALDPKGILNPGKLFKPFRIWDHKPAAVRLPWDH